MRFRRALAAAVLCAVAAPTAAPAQEARQVEIGYAITYLGFTGFRIDFTGRFDGGRYDVQSHTFKEGLIKAVTIGYEGRNRAWGGFVQNGAQPSGGSLSIVVGGKPRTWAALYGPGGMVSEQNHPPWKPQPDQVIPDNERLRSLDPLTAVLSVGMKGDAACDQVAPSNDGKRRIDVILKKVGTDTPHHAGVPQAKDDLLICEIYTKRIAGEFYDAPEEAESKRETPMRMWMARLDDTPFRYPVKLEAKQSLGTVHGTMLYFRERPLTDAEKASIGK